MAVPCTACIDWQENGDGSQFVCEICDLSECSTNRGPQENVPTKNDEDSASTMDIEDSASTMDIEDSASTMDIEDSASTMDIEDSASTMDIEDSASTMDIEDSASTMDIEDSASTMESEDKFPHDDDGEEDKPVPRRNVEMKVWMKVEDMVIIDTANHGLKSVGERKGNDCNFKETKWNVYQSLDYENYWEEFNIKKCVERNEIYLYQKSRGKDCRKDKTDVLSFYYTSVHVYTNIYINVYMCTQTFT